MKIVATFTKRTGRFNKKIKMTFSCQKQYEQKRDELIDQGWKVASYTQVG